MKWTEPWAFSIKHQEKLNLISKEVLLRCLKWSLLFLVLIIVSFAAHDNYVQTVISRLWIAPTFGFILSWFLYVVSWLSPIKIDSGPNGIVRLKGGAIILFPWDQITKYEITELTDINKLTLILNNSSEHFFFIPKKVKVNPIKEELDLNLGAK